MRLEIIPQACSIVLMHFIPSDDLRYNCRTNIKSFIYSLPSLLCEEWKGSEINMYVGFSVAQASFVQLRKFYKICYEVNAVSGLRFSKICVSVYIIKQHLDETQK